MNNKTKSMMQRIVDGTYVVYENTEQTEFDYLIIVAFRADIEDLYYTFTELIRKGEINFSSDGVIDNAFTTRDIEDQMYGLIINISKRKLYIVPEEYVNEMEKRNTRRYVELKEKEEVGKILS